MSAMVRGVIYHLVSYYNMDHVTTGLLEQPSQAQALSGITLRPDLTPKQCLPAPLENMEETMDRAWDGYQGMYGGYGSLAQQDYYSNSNSYHSHEGPPVTTCSC
jgi:hypothetical protein